MYAPSAERWPRGAVEHDPLVALRDHALDARFEIAARNVQGTGDVALVPFVLLAHVDDHQLLGSVAVARLQLVDLGGIDLLDLRANLLDVLTAGLGHRNLNLTGRFGVCFWIGIELNTLNPIRFRKYSNVPAQPCAGPKMSAAALSRRR